MKAAAIVSFFLPLITVPCFLWTQTASTSGNEDANEDEERFPTESKVFVPEIDLSRNTNEDGNHTVSENHRRTATI